MNLAEIIAALQAQITALQTLQSSQTQFSQADIDAAVLAAVGPLNDQVSALQVLVAAFPEQQTKAVSDAVSAAKDAFVAVLTAVKEKEDQAIADAVASL